VGMREKVIEEQEKERKRERGEKERIV